MRVLHSTCLHGVESPNRQCTRTPQCISGHTAHCGYATHPIFSATIKSRVAFLHQIMFSLRIVPHSTHSAAGVAGAQKPKAATVKNRAAHHHINRLQQNSPSASVPYVHTRKHLTSPDQTNHERFRSTPQSLLRQLRSPSSPLQIQSIVVAGSPRNQELHWPLAPAKRVIIITITTPYRYHHHYYTVRTWHIKAHTHSHGGAAACPANAMARPQSHYLQRYTRSVNCK